MVQRRDILKYSALTPLLCSAPVDALWARGDDIATGTASKFDYAVLKGQARALAAAAYQPPPKVAPESLLALDYDQYQSIRFQREHALWGDADRGFRLEFFHIGRGFHDPVRIFDVVDGQAREIPYQPALFDLSRSGVKPRSLPANLGFAGFRIHTAINWESDVASFLGASYLRAVGGDTRQFGLSARGLAIDTIAPPEEFPRFTSFWFERPQLNARSLVLYALLDTPKAAGAYRFHITPGAPLIMDVDAAIYPRQTIERLGIAPLTSMFQCGENDRRMANDWRPEVHDSDGLSMLSGTGEWIWRPLNNPTGVRVNSYLDENIAGFGLLQRDRDFNNYQDDGVFYERRPSLWIEPKAGWGKGAVQLVEIPTPDETFDNIVAFWNPAETPQAGQELLYGYKMYWGTQMPTLHTIGEAIATRTGIGGIVGQRRKYFSWRFAVDFAGGELASILPTATVEPVISASAGTVEITSARPLTEVRGYRAMFDIRPPEGSVEPINIRVFLRRNGQPLTETWIYQWTPPSAEERAALLAKASI